MFYILFLFLAERDSWALEQNFDNDDDVFIFIKKNPILYIK